MKNRTKLYDRYKGLIPTLVGVLAVAGLVINVQPAAAQTLSGPTMESACMQTVFSGDISEPIPSSSKLNCTANDIRLSRVLNVSPTQCFRGSKINLTATFEVDVTANARYDAGFFFNTTGGSNARLGDCSLSILKPTGVPGLNLDNDTCGDLNSGLYTYDSIKPGSTPITFYIPNVTCKDSNDDGTLDLPYCTSWHSSSSTVCWEQEAATGPNSADPDTKSKCVCDDSFQIPIKVLQASLGVTKLVTPTELPEPGGTFTFTVSVTNSQSFDPITVVSVHDDKHGIPVYEDPITETKLLYYDLAQLPICTEGLPNADNPECTLPTDGAYVSCQELQNMTLKPNETKTCAFKVFVNQNGGFTETDRAEVCVTQAGFEQWCGSDDAVITISNLPGERPTLTKTVLGARKCQMEVEYSVVVNNNSTVDTLFLDKLLDNKFGDITSTHPAYTDGTNKIEEVTVPCDLALASAGIAPLGNFTCTFKGIVVSENCTGLTHTNVVQASAYDDDGEPFNPTAQATITFNAPNKGL